MNKSESLEIVEAPKSFSPFGLLLVYYKHSFWPLCAVLWWNFERASKGTWSGFFTLNFFHICTAHHTYIVCSFTSIQSLLHHFARKASSTVVRSLLGDGIMMKNCAKSLTLRVLMVDVSRWLGSLQFSSIQIQVKSYVSLGMEANVTSNDNNNDDPVLRKARKLWLWVDTVALDNISFFLFCFVVLMLLIVGVAWLFILIPWQKTERVGEKGEFSPEIANLLMLWSNVKCQENVSYFDDFHTHTHSLQLHREFHGIASMNSSHHKSVADPIIVLFHGLFLEMFTPLSHNSRYSRSSSFRIVLPWDTAAALTQSEIFRHQCRWEKRVVARTNVNVSQSQLKVL